MKRILLSLAALAVATTLAVSITAQSSSDPPIGTGAAAFPFTTDPNTQVVGTWVVTLDSGEQVSGFASPLIQGNPNYWRLKPTKAELPACPPPFPEPLEGDTFKHIVSGDNLVLREPGVFNVFVITLGNEINIVVRGEGQFLNDAVFAREKARELAPMVHELFRRAMPEGE